MNWTCSKGPLQNKDGKKERMKGRERGRKEEAKGEGKREGGWERGRGRDGKGERGQHALVSRMFSSPCSLAAPG